VNERVGAIGQHVLDVAGTDAGLHHGRGIRIDLDLGGPAATKVELEPGRDGDDEHVTTAVHGGGGVFGRDDPGVLEAGWVERGDQLLGELGLVLVDEGEAGVVDLGLDAPGLRDDRQSERVQDEGDEHRVARQAAQLLETEPEDVGGATHG
jgi:hypothetical protein